MSMSIEELQGHLKKAYLETFKDDDITHAQRFKHVLELLLQTTGSILLSPLSYYLNILREFDKTQLTNMTPEEKIKCKQRLYITYLLLLQDKETRQADVECCADLLDNLDLDIQIMPDEMPKKIKFIEYAHAYPGKPAAYTGIQTGLCLGQRSMDILTWVNEKRLYWVWGGGLLRTVLSLLQEDFYNQQNATLVATAPSRFTGYLSWSLYFARFALNSFLLINDTFSPELTEKEREMGKWAYWERFRTQWSLRKFTLLNDFFWGIANMVCFFWLHGSDGDALTLSLLIFDIGITLWDFMEQETKFNKDHDDYEEKIKGLIKKREVILDKDVVAQINLDLNKLFREQTQCKTHWDNKKMALVSNMIYAFGLFIAFALLTMPFMPFAPAILLITGVIGSVLCFTMTVIAGIIKGSLAIQSSRLSSKDTADYCQEKISLFAADNSSADDMKKICLFMEIRQ